MVGSRGVLETYLYCFKEEDMPEYKLNRNRSPKITEYLPWGDFPKGAVTCRFSERQKSCEPEVCACASLGCTHICSGRGAAKD